MPLQKLLNVLEGRPARRMRVPSLWNAIGFECEDAGGGEVFVDGAAFFAAALRYCLEGERSPAFGDAIYALLPRHFTAWDHGDGLEGGTFLKAIALLPHIKRLGAEIVYLLPVFTPSGVYKKGSLGSPYAIKDFFSLDPALHDPLLGDFSNDLLELQFAAFVEACHALGMKTMVDFVFRSCARDNVLLSKHPEWFYWIGMDGLDSFAPPYVHALPGNTNISPEAAKALYAAPETPAYIARFRNNPRALDAEKFGKCGGDLAEIERAFKLTTAPAFSDVLNDRQPYWSDVTYLRMDLGRNAFAKRFKDAAALADAPPFVLHDAIKLDLFPPEKPNKRLFTLMEKLIPHYIERFGIDGARIDMGHALPKALLKSMISRVREANPDFILWSEVFDISRAEHEAALGFDFVTGDVCFTLKSLLYGEAAPGLTKLINGGACVFAPELPDTPRAALLYDAELPKYKNGKVRARRFAAPKNPSAAWKSAVTLSALFPNARPFFCAGLELGETQPMNLGLGESCFGRFALPQDDPDYGKLAFFDVCRLHWTASSKDRIGHIKLCMNERAKFL